MNDSRRPNLADSIERLATASEAQTRLLEVAIDRSLPKPEPRGYRSDPRKLSFLTVARAVPGLAACFTRRIPAQFWSLDSNSAVISCPCGATPVSEHGAVVTCECDRAYLYDGVAVRVAFGPNDPVAQPDASLVD